MTYGEKIIAQADRINTEAEKVKGIYEAGYEQGKADGYEAGRVFYNDFWDTFQSEGQRKNYANAFSANSDNTGGWSADAFVPKYDMHISNARQMFARFPSEGGSLDMKSRCEELGIELDFSNCTDIFQMCYASKITRFGVLDFSKVTQSGWLPNNASVAWVEKIILPKNAPISASGLFNESTKLAHCPVEGEFTQSVNASNCPFDVETAKSFIIALKNYSGTDYEYTYTLTFKSTVWNALDAEGATSPNGNTWREYTDDKGWKT